MLPPRRTPTSSQPTWKRSSDDSRTSGLEVSRPSRGPTTGHGASNSAGNDKGPRNHGAFVSTPGGTRTANLLIRSHTDTATSGVT